MKKIKKMRKKGIREFKSLYSIRLSGAFPTEITKTVIDCVADALCFSKKKRGKIQKKVRRDLKNKI